MYKLFMALRYLRAHRIIYFSITGVAFGIMVMIIVTSVMGGFSRDIRMRIRGVQSHILVRALTYEDTIPNYDALSRRLRGLPNVTGCAPRLEYLAWLTLPSGVGSRRGQESSRFPDVQVLGIDPEQEVGTGELEEYFKKGEPGTFSRETFAPRKELPALIVGSEINAYIGTKVVLQSARKGEEFPVPLIQPFTISGWFRSGMAEYDSKLVFLHLSDMQKFLKFRAEPYANVLAVGVRDYERNGTAVRRAIVEALHEARPCNRPDRHERFQCGLLDVRTWEEERRTLLAAVEVEKGIQFIIIFCIVIVAGFNIIAIYTLMVRAKTRDIGVLKALGATPGGIVLVFLLSGGACGVVGSILGIGAGVLLSVNLNEIVDFVRISSRELNRLRLGGSGAVGLAQALSDVALAALVFSWIRLYRPWKSSVWVTSGILSVLLGAACWVFLSWIPGYEVLRTYDWPVPPSARVWITLAVGGAPLAWAALRRVAEPAYYQTFGGAFRIAGTVVYSALMLMGVTVTAVTAALIALRPDRRFEGFDLFPRHIYYLDRVPVYIDAWTVAFLVAATLIVSVIFSIYPAIRAARTDPIEAIRDE